MDDDFLFIQAKWCLLNILPLTVDCEEKWVSKKSYTFNFFKFDRSQEVLAERKFLEIYYNLYQLFSTESNMNEDGTWDLFVPPPPPLKIKNINYKIKITKEDIVSEIVDKILLLRSALDNYYDSTSTTSELVEHTEYILEIFNDICSLKYFYRQKQQFIQQQFFNKKNNLRT